MLITSKIDSREVDVLIKQLRRRSINLRPAMQSIEQEIVDGIEQIFEDEGPGWPELSPITEADRAAEGKAGKMLQRDGALAASIQTGNEITNDKVVVSTNVDYAAHLHYGTSQTVTPKQRIWLGVNLGMWTKPGTRITNPARPYMLITDGAADEAERILADHLAGKL